LLNRLDFPVKIVDDSYTRVTTTSDNKPRKAETMKTVTCPKCCGNRRFETLSHICSGVCFQCNGAGTVTVKPAKKTEQQIADEQLTARRREFVLSLTPGKIASLTWKQLHGAATFATACVVQGETEMQHAHRMIMRRIGELA
jgi:hypothetical protein